MTAIEFEDATVEHLNAGFLRDGVPIKAKYFPDRPADYRLSKAHGEVLVHYRSSQYGAPQGLQQARVPQLEIIVVATNRRTEKIGALHIMDAVRRYLTSWLPDGWANIYPASEDLIEEKDGVWYYGMKFVTGTTYWAGE